MSLFMYQVQYSISKHYWQHLELKHQYLVQLIEQPILRIPNILFGYFLSIFSR
jgi:hypothetical protein